MKNSEILQRYKMEVNSQHYREIHKKYKSESSTLYNKYNIKNRLSVPLAIIAVLLVIGGISCIILEEPIAFYILLVVLIITLIVRKINNKIIESKENKAHSNGSSYSTELINLKYNYLRDYNSVIGLIADVHDSCGDCDERTERYYCSVTGRPLSYTEYNNCQKKFAFDRCECSKMYYDNLYED